MSHKEKIIALVPARLDSRRIPGKNIEILGDSPLFIHSIRFASKLAGISEVILSTDSDEIEAIAQEENCRVTRRSQETSEYGATNFDVIKDAIPKITEITDVTPDIILLLQPTHPFRSTDEINASIRRFMDTPDASSLVSVKEITESVGRVDDGEWKPISSMSPETRKSREQLYMNSGNFYLFRTALTFDQDTFFGDKILAFPISKPTIDVNIDLPHELELARVIHDHGFDLLDI